MSSLDMQRIQEIVTRVLQQQEQATFAAGRVSPLTKLQADLYNTLHAEYPGLDPNIHVRAEIIIGSDVTVTIEHVEKIGEFHVQV